MRDNFDEWAHYYDIIYKSKYKDLKDYGFYESLMSDVDGKILEVACGSGRIYLEALDDGYSVEGIDISEDMLEILRKRAENRNLEPTVYNQDIKNLDVDSTYELIYFPFSAMCHIRSVSGQTDAFQNIYEHLDSGGRFAFDAPAPSLDFRDTHNKVSRETVEHNGTSYLCEYWNEVVNEVEQEHLFHQRVINSETRSIEFETTFELTLLPKEQLELLLLNAGFSNYSFYKGFHQKPLSSDTDRLVVVASK
jgi:SAM-dependent methyltransferase